MTKIVQIQFSIESGGRAALRLQKAFINAGLQSNIISLQPGAGDIPNITFMKKSAGILAKIDTKIENYLTKNSVKEYGLFSYPLLGSNVAKLPLVADADIIYIHWAFFGFLNFKSIDQLAALNKPVIVFMHDMWNISGGCHYSFSCNKYETGCHNCQMFTGDKQNDLSAKGFKKKMQLYAKYNNLYFVSPSTWLYNCAKNALLTKNKPVFYIPNVLDTTLFKPFDKVVAKKILNIPTEKRVIAFGAVSVSSPYKGWAYLRKALEVLKEDNAYEDVLVVIFGSGYNKDIADSIPFEIKFMGHLRDEYSTMLVYNAADVFVVPSLADNQPTTVQESLSCGTPVVGFNIGGIPDMIKHKENGYLATYKDAVDVTGGIKYCLQNKLAGYRLPVFETDLTVSKHLELFDYIKTSKNNK